MQQKLVVLPASPDISDAMVQAALDDLAEHRMDFTQANSIIRSVFWAMYYQLVNDVRSSLVNEPLHVGDDRKDLGGNLIKST